MSVPRVYRAVSSILASSWPGVEFTPTEQKYDHIFVAVDAILYQCLLDGLDTSARQLHERVRALLDHLLTLTAHPVCEIVLALPGVGHLQQLYSQRLDLDEAASPVLLHCLPGLPEMAELQATIRAWAAAQPTLHVSVVPEFVPGDSYLKLRTAARRVMDGRCAMYGQLNDATLSALALHAEPTCLDIDLVLWAHGGWRALSVADMVPRNRLPEIMPFLCMFDQSMPTKPGQTYLNPRGELVLVQKLLLGGGLTVVQQALASPTQQVFSSYPPGYARTCLNLAAFYLTDQLDPAVLYEFLEPPDEWRQEPLPVPVDFAALGSRDALTLVLNPSLALDRAPYLLPRVRLMCASGSGGPLPLRTLAALPPDGEGAVVPRQARERTETVVEPRVALEKAAASATADLSVLTMTPSTPVLPALGRLIGMPELLEQAAA
jgi:hypothetical protein